MKQNKNKNKDKINEMRGSTPSNLNEKGVIRKYSSVKLKNPLKDKKKPNKVVRLQTCPTIQTTQF